MILEIDLSRLDIFSDKYIKLFELKCNQKIIKYKKNHVFKVFFIYYLRVLYSFLHSFKVKRVYNNSIVISHLDSIDNYGYLNKEKYCKYNKLNNNIIYLVSEIIKFPKYLYWFLNIKSDYKNQIFEAFLKSQIIIGFTKKYNLKKIIFFGYDYDLVFLYATIQLNQINIQTELYCNSGFLGVHNLEVANKVYCRTKIHKYYMLSRKDIFLSKDINYLFNSKRISNQTIVNKIAIYTSGYYARSKLNFTDNNTIHQGIISEQQIIETMRKYAIENPNIDIVLFIHLHNNIENIIDAKIYYKDFLSLDNVRLQDENENSIENFNSYDLGVCCMSEIFFDRYERGYKTILMNPFALDDFIINSTLKNVTVYSNNLNTIDKINDYLKMKDEKYFNLLEKNE